MSRDWLHDGFLAFVLRDELGTIGTMGRTSRISAILRAYNRVNRKLSPIIPFVPKTRIRSSVRCLRTSGNYSSDLDIRCL
jgi:hypothetical protein